MAADFRCRALISKPTGLAADQKINKGKLAKTSLYVKNDETQPLVCDQQHGFINIDVPSVRITGQGGIDSPFDF
jgi:hypothetical protein